MSAGYSPSGNARGLAAREFWQIPKAGWKEIAKRTWTETGEDNISLLAAGVAFYSFLAFVPMLAAIVLIYGIVADPANVASHMQTLVRILPTDAAKIVADQMKSLTQTPVTRTTIGLVIAILLAIYGAMRGATSVIGALNVTYGERETRNFLRATGLSAAFIRPAAPDADLALLDRLALHAVRHWTPTAAVSGSDGVWLDPTGAAHLHGGEDRFCRRVISLCRRLGLMGRIAVAGTPGAAHALARFGGAPIEQIDGGGEAQALSRLPLACLRLTPEALAAAARFGFESVGDLLQLPRGPLARRLGMASIRRLDEALGRVAEPIVPLIPEDNPAAVRRLLEPIGTAEAIEHVIRDLVADLVEQLRARGVGVRALVLALDRIDGSEQRVAIGTVRATRDEVHLARLFHLRIERIDPGDGIETMRIAATRLEPLGATALAATLAGDPDPADLSTLVDQLAGRAESHALFTIGEVETDVPERATARLGPLDTPAGWPAWKRPVRLLRRPEPLANVVALLPDQPPRRFTWRGKLHSVVAGDGPERIHGEWWRHEGEVWAVRDYYRVEDETGARFWLFRRGDGVDGMTGDLSWHMHGIFG